MLESEHETVKNYRAISRLLGEREISAGGNRFENSICR